MANLDHPITPDDIGNVKYSYDSLDSSKDEIRLLKFSKDTSDSTWSSTACSVVTVALPEAPAYCAISYVWGDPTHLRDIELDGLQVPVLATAVEALQQMHAAAFIASSHTAYIWVDAVCIDLDNDQERAQQVMIMSEIYSNATQVLAFLGLSFSGHVEIQTSICASARALREAAGSRKGLNRLLNFDTDLSVAEYLNGLDKALLAKFYASPWFTRLWILQEAALARVAMVFYGDHSIPLPDVIIVARALVKMERHSGHFEVSRDALSHGIRHCKTLFNLRVWHACKLNLAHEGDCRRGQCHSGLPLTYLLEVMHNHANSEMRDKVYAILGLAHVSVAHDLRPNYKLPLEVVYTQATRLAFQQDNSYEVMRWARTNGNHLNEWYREHHWPTWLPLWQEPYGRLKNPSGLPWWTFRASNSRTVIFPTELCDPVLRCEGVFIDDLQYTSSTLLPGGKFKEDDQTALQALQDAIRVFSPMAQKARGVRSDIDIDSHIMALAGTLAAGALRLRSQDEYNARQPPPRNNKAVLTASELAEMAHSSLTRNADASSAGQAMKYLYHFQFHSRFRKFFLTKDGYMGIASQHVRMQDSLFLAMGNSVPWILRREEGHYLFMGVCYVHGIMQGELASELGVEDIAEKAQWVDIH